jgi:phage gpG-like protein
MKIRGIQTSIRKMKARADNFSGRNPKVYIGISKDVGRSIAQNFNAQGRPKWTKRKGEYSHPILDKTGKLRDAVEASTVRWNFMGHEYTMRIMGPEYGIFHQYGCGNLVAREFVLFQASEMAIMRSRFIKAFSKP